MLQQKYNQRAFKDRITRYGVAVGGISVIIAILLIFFYLLQVVIPMFESAEMSESHSYSISDESKILHLGLEEQGTMGVRFMDNGDVVFFKSDTGETIRKENLNLPAKITSLAFNIDRVILGLENGHVKIVRYIFDLSYPNDVRTLTPALEFPFGDDVILLDDSENPLNSIDFQINEEAFGIVAKTQDKRLVYARYIQEESFITEEITTELESRSEQTFDTDIHAIVLTPALDHLYVALEGGVLRDYSLDEEGFDGNHNDYKIKHRITQLQLLLGGNSLLIGLDNGEVQQWMSVRNEYGRVLTFIRNFHETSLAISEISIEQQRKSFAVADVKGAITLYYSTSQRTLVSLNTANQTITNLAWSSRAQNLLAVDNEGKLYLYDVDNEYPEVSWDVLWGKIWYEGYDESDYIWQSSASTNEFEPKFSLMPLTFGTIKAAFYAMLFAVPIAILGAMFTAQFMAPRMRQVVKPSIEIMEALPTVILGFLAGLWLAPYVETHLAGIFTLLLILPFGFILSAWLFGFVSNKSIFDGWEAALLIPVVLFMIWLSMSLSGPVENVFFDGDMRTYMSDVWGFNYDQRNALVVGLIMGFAIIPTIFSIAEDAIFSVPQHLIRGSLALGASRWQTMTSVVMPAASPAIFSAVMMGFGRAVGETMIVLMATGNTPLMDMSIFQGMRTLAANIAVEVPEAEVASTHYRILFLAAFILFMFTFVFNTFAEMIRHRLRKKYSGL
ncbi:MAG: phosphate ABC transporter permease [endosymbiont of Galathealinum brachiosum]|uniref:Phosphate ABC transporter permease n=1 Tax=endosymbiont of Galathealinum brachiosum TaxID=2200906 RepID=A0A370DGS0_9GAMM|nr:MAG: phosphate ABC transporter permease [endosymbiont of Galathealinum brachiosum]